MHDGARKMHEATFRLTAGVLEGRIRFGPQSPLRVNTHRRPEMTAFS